MFATRSSGIPKRRQHFGTINFFRLAMAAHLQRRQLKKLNNRGLKDIGLTREQATKEASRPIWDVPQNWLK